MNDKHPNAPGGDLDQEQQQSSSTILAEDDDRTPEILPPGTSLAVQLMKAEIDLQVSTAKAYPRVLSDIKKNINELATLDEETAEECMYALPRGKKPIKGPSIRFAEIVASQYGNCHSAARVMHVDHDFVEAEGVFIDLEKNVRKTRRVRRRILDKSGQRYNSDMINMTSNAACSIAERNAILAAVPKALWRQGYEKVYALIAGTVSTLAEKRGKALKAFGLYGVTPEQVFQVLHVKGEADITVDHIPTLRGILSAIKNEEETVESIFAPGRIAAGKDFKKVDATLSSQPKPDAAKSDAATGGGSDLGRKDASGDGPHGDSPPAAQTPLPETAEDWPAYIELRMNTFTDGDALNAWFNSKPEKDLRKNLGVPVDDARAVREAVEALAKKLKNGAAG